MPDADKDLSASMVGIVVVVFAFMGMSALDASDIKSPISPDNPGTADTTG